jgi:hypothetical protein
MCESQQPLAEGFCAVASIAGLGAAMMGETVTVVLCLAGTLIGSILLFGDRLERQRRYLQKKYGE